MKALIDSLLRILSFLGMRVCFPKGVHDKANIKWSIIDRKAKVGAYSLMFKSKVHGKVEIGDHSFVGESTLVGKVKIGRYTSFNGPGSDVVTSTYGVMIGNFCSIARYCTIQEHNHIHNRCTTYSIFKNLIDAEERQQCIWRGSEEKDIVSRGPIIIGHDVWIGAQVVVLSGVNIGHGAVIAANSTVTRDVPPYAIVGGTPANVIKYRFSEEVIQALLKLAWWDWDDERIRANQELFESELTLEKLEKFSDK